MSQSQKHSVSSSKTLAWRQIGLAAALALLVISTSMLATAQDTRTVTEPTFPTTICQTLQANLQATGAGLQGVDEAADANYDTIPIQNAIDACNTIYAQTSTVQAIEFAASGANNAFLTGPLTLKAGVVLLVDPGVTIFGSRRPHDYDSGPTSHLCGTIDSSGQRCKPLIGGNSTANSGIMGYGIIDGQGDKPMISNPSCYSGYTCAGYTWWQLGDFTGTVGGKQNNPRMIDIDGANNFVMYKITLQNSPKFNVAPGGNGMTLWGVKISAPYTSPNTDGFDPSGSRNVTLTNSYISVGDDEVAIKAASASSDMTFSHNHFYSGHGMSVGSETNGGLSNVLVTDLVMAGDVDDTNNNGLRIKSDSAKGGIVQNIVYDGVCMRDTDHPLVFDAYYSSSTGALYPDYRSIAVRNVHILNDPAFDYFSSSKNIVFRGYNSTYPLNITLDNVVLDQPTLPSQFLSQSANITLGPGPVNFASSVPIFADIRSNSNPPYDCTDKWIYLASELFSSPNSSVSPVTITSSQVLPLSVILQPIVSSDPLPNGTVTINDNGDPSLTVPLSTIGWLTQLHLAGLSAGQHTFTAHFSGDAVTTKYVPMDFGSLAVTVTDDPTAVSTVTALTVASHVDLGAALQLTATVTAGNGTSTPTGTVDFFEGSTMIGAAPLDGAGTATLTLSTLTLGAHDLKATYEGANGAFSSSLSTPQSVTVTAATATTLTSSTSTLDQGSSLTLTARVSSSNGTPGSGTVTFFDGANSLGAAEVDPTGTATLTTSSLLIGSHLLTASYAGNVSFSASTSSGITVVVNAASVSTTTTLTANPTTVTAGGSVTFTATVTATSGTPTGTVTFSEGGNSLGTGTLNASGVATFSTTTLSIGSHSISAAYGGATGFAASTSSATAVTVNAIATVTVLTPSSTTAFSNDSVTFTATVTSNSGTPTGTVTFYDGTTQIAAGTLNASGVATAQGILTLSGTSAETHNVSAKYAGTGSYAASTSPSVPITVTPVSFSITAPASTTLNVAIGGSATATTTLTSSGFTGAVTLGCTAPSYVTCTFSPASPVSLSRGDNTPLAVTVHVASTMAASQQHALPFGPVSIPAIFAFVPLMIWPGRKKVRGKLLLGILALMLGMACVGCGGGSNTAPGGPTKPPTGPQTVTVKATSGSISATPLTLTVNITN